MVILPHRRKAFRGEAVASDGSIANAVYETSFLVTVGLEYQTPSGIFFAPDGLTLFLIDSSGDNLVTYTLSTAWDVSTAVFTSVKDVSVDGGGTGSRRDLFFNSLGTLLYFAEYTGQDIQQYSLSQGWTGSTAMPDGAGAELATGLNDLQSVSFSADGLKVFYLTGVGGTGERVYQRTLTVAWDLSTAGAETYYNIPNSTDPNSIHINATGTKMYIAGDANDDIRQYSLETPWDVETASYDNEALDVSDKENQLKGMFMTDEKLYIVGWQNDTIYQYSL